MQAIIQEIRNAPPMDAIAAHWQALSGFAHLRTGTLETPGSRYSILAAEPFLSFRSFGADCVVSEPDRTWSVQGNPWRIMERMLRPLLLDQEDASDYPVGAMLGYWGYDLKDFTEPKLLAHRPADPLVPDCHVGFFGTLLLHDHLRKETIVVATGLQPDGNRSKTRAEAEVAKWRTRIEQVSRSAGDKQPSASPNATFTASQCMTRERFLQNVVRAKEYIRAGDIYQVNLSQSWIADCPRSWDFFRNLCQRSPAPFSAFLRCGTAEIVSSSPEQFLRFSGVEAQARPIKGTRPRGRDPEQDRALAEELRSNAKENAELLMITDLLRNDLGKVCAFGSVRVPELSSLERYSHVQHLVSTVEGRLRPGLSHLEAMEACFPGGSITGAPKFRAMQIIHELEPAARGPYTGALGYIGFNKQSLLSILIRIAVCAGGKTRFSAGAGIVADSDPEAEYTETQIKAQAIVEALEQAACPASPEILSTL